MTHYVKFNDSAKDPTYTTADDVSLVYSPEDRNYENPCSREALDSSSEAFSTPLFPDQESIHSFARFFGFGVQRDPDTGRILLVTDLYSPLK